MRRICVIGGAGFIGGALVRELLREGREVTVLGRRAPAPDRRAPEARYVEGDYADRDLLDRLLGASDAVVDLAYSTVPKSSYDDPVKDIIGNLPPSVGLLQAAARARIRRVILASSGGTVYGVARGLPLSEDHPTCPISPYGITKLALENYGRMFHVLEDLHVVIVRPSNAFGEGQRPFVGQGFVATAMGSLLADREFTLFGESGTIRDYVHVEDVARGIAAALESGAPGEVYNIGSGEGRNGRQVLDDIRRVAGSDGDRLRLRIQPSRRFDVPSNVLDSSKLERCSGWRPRIDWADGLDRAWRWLKRQPATGGSA